jgi:large subunit ribosomal protein L1
VTTDIKKTIANLKKGMASYKNDDSGNVHLIVGKASFSEKDLLENIQSAIEAIKRSKSDTTKGTFILSTTLSSSMGPGIKLVL